MMPTSLKLENDRFNQKWVQRGGKLTRYLCNHCLKMVETPQPKEREVSKKGFWDKVAACIFCGRVNFVKVFPDGNTESTKIRN